VAFIGHVCAQPPMAAPHHQCVIKPKRRPGHRGKCPRDPLADDDVLGDFQLRTPTTTNPGYGYLTWLNAGPFWVTPSGFAEATNPAPMIASAPEDMYFSYGFFGQHVFVIPSVDMVVTRSSRTLNWPPNRTDVGDLVTAIAPTQPTRIEYEFFKQLMASVQTPDQPPAKPYVAPAPGAVDADLFINAQDNLATIGLPPGAPEGCTILGCDGTIAGAGTLRTLMDASQTKFADLPRLIDGIREFADDIPNLPTRLLDGWQQTAAITGQQLPSTLPALLTSVQTTLDSILRASAEE
jgi:hypothetical protein